MTKKQVFGLFYILALFFFGIYFFTLSYFAFKAGSIGVGFVYIAFGAWVWTPPKWDPLFILFDKIWGKKDG